MVMKFSDHGRFICIATQDYIVSVASYFNREMIILHLFSNLLQIFGILIRAFLVTKIQKFTNSALINGMSSH